MLLGTRRTLIVGIYRIRWISCSRIILTIKSKRVRWSWRWGACRRVSITWTWGAEVRSNSRSKSTLLDSTWGSMWQLWKPWMCSHRVTMSYQDLRGHSMAFWINARLQLALDFWRNGWSSPQQRGLRSIRGFKSLTFCIRTSIWGAIFKAYTWGPFPISKSSTRSSTEFKLNWGTTLS